MAANCAGLCARVCGRVDWAHGDGCGRAGLPTLSTCRPHTWTRAPRLQVWVSAAIKFSYHNSDPRTQSSLYVLSHFCIPRCLIFAFAPTHPAPPTTMAASVCAFPARTSRVRRVRWDGHFAACVPCRTPARLCSTRSVPPTPAQIRISSQHLQSGQFSGQQVRAVGKLVSHNGDNVQLQLAGEGEPSDARAHATQRICSHALTTLLLPVGRPRGHGPLQP